MNCKRCGSPLALADERCQACGLEAPKTERAALFLAKAESAFEAERPEDGLRFQERALELLEGEALSGALRKHAMAAKKLAQIGGPGSGAWREKSAASLARARELRDEDEGLHHLWIDLMAESGRLAEAAAYYQKRVQASPDDQRALRMLQVVRLATDFKAAPPKVVLDLGEPSRIERWIMPSKLKVAVLGSSAVGSLGIALLMWLQGGGSSASQLAADPAFDPSGASLSLILSDPATWFWSGMLPLALLGAMAWMRR